MSERNYQHAILQKVMAAVTRCGASFADLRDEAM
jgi:hypothetical protein